MKNKNEENILTASNPQSYYSNFISKEEGLKKIIEGINYASDIVGSTLGSAGKNALLQTQYPPFHIVTNDGVSIAKTLVHQDPFVNMGINLIKNVTASADFKGGDGTTSACVLARSLINICYEKGLTGMKVKRELDNIKDIIIQKIKDKKIEITSDNVYDVALTSSEDKEIATLISDIYKNELKDRQGVIEVVNNFKNSIDKEVIDGYNVHGIKNAICIGVNSTHFELENPSIFFVNKNITNINDIIPILGCVKENNLENPVLFYKEMDNQVLFRLVELLAKQNIRIALIGCPVIFGDYIIEDLPIFCGTKQIHPSYGINISGKMKNEEQKQLINFVGRCEKIIVKDNDLIVSQGAGVGSEILNSHVEMLNKKFTEEGHNDSGLRRDWLKSLLINIKVGADTEPELYYKKLKIEDCKNACKHAIKDGVVLGGGVTLRNIANKIDLDSEINKVIFNCLKSIQEKIISNYSNEFVVNLEKENEGFNTTTGKIEDFSVSKIYDPVNVLCSSVSSAFSLAGTVLSIDSVVFMPPNTQSTQPYEGQ